MAGPLLEEDRLHVGLEELVARAPARRRRSALPARAPPPANARRRHHGLPHSRSFWLRLSDLADREGSHDAGEGASHGDQRFDGPSVAGAVGAAARLEQEPAALLGLVDEDLAAGSRSPRPRGRRQACGPCACSRRAPCCRPSARTACRPAGRSPRRCRDRCSFAMWPIERMVVPPTLRTVGQCRCLDAPARRQQVVAAEMRAADVPVEILGLHIERERVGQQRVERPKSPTASSDRSVGVSSGGRLRGSSFRTLLLTEHLMSWGGCEMQAPDGA